MGGGVEAEAEEVEEEEEVVEVVVVVAAGRVRSDDRLTFRGV